MKIIPFLLYQGRRCNNGKCRIKQYKCLHLIMSLECLHLHFPGKTVSSLLKLDEFYMKSILWMET